MLFTLPIGRWYSEHFNTLYLCVSYTALKPCSCLWSVRHHIDALTVVKQFSRETRIVILILCVIHTLGYTWWCFIIPALTTYVIKCLFRPNFIQPSSNALLDLHFILLFLFPHVSVSFTDVWKIMWRWSVYTGTDTPMM